MIPVSCVSKGGRPSYGGSQMWYEDKILVNSGCGIIAGLDSLLHLRGMTEVDRDTYLQMMSDASAYIRPIMLPFKIKPMNIAGREFLGSFGLTMHRLKRGLRKLAASQKVECRVRSFRRDFVNKTRAVLANDTPVIMLVRAPFENVKLISDTPGYMDETIGQHFVTVTDYDAEKDMFVVSSWGRRYKIDIESLKKFSVAVSFCYIEDVNTL